MMLPGDDSDSGSDQPGTTSIHDISIYIEIS